MTYADHVQAASRYAAAALTMPAPTPDQAPAVRVLQDDLAALLAEMTREITGLAPAKPYAVEVSDLARHPVRLMLNRLAVLPRRATYDDPAAAPSIRLAGRAPTPEHATTPRQVWQGVVVETLQARHLLAGHAPRMTDEQRWAALSDVAALAGVLATTRTDLLTAITQDTTAVRRERSNAAALSVEAREVARLSGTPTTPTGTTWQAPRPGPGIVFVSRTSDLAPAAANLGRLLDRRQGSVTDLLAITGLLAQTSRATARALHVAARHDPDRAPTLLPAAIALGGHADSLAKALTVERAALAALAGGSPALLAQGREIGAHALPRVHDLTRAPARAHQATPDLLAYAALAPSLTHAVRAGVEHAAREHAVAIRDRVGDAPYRWRPASTIDLGRFLANLSHAAALATPPAPVRAPEPAARPTASVGPTAPARHDGLVAALERRRDELRPARPSTALLTGRFAPVRRHSHPRPASWM